MLWKISVEFFDVKCNLATTNHHQTTGQVEKNNQYVETYLRCFVKTFDDEEWLKYLYLAEFCYNNAVHSSTHQSPFMTLYNYQVHFNPQTSELVHSLGATAMIDSFAHNLANLKHMLEITQTRYIDNMDKHRTDNCPDYKLYYLVWLKRPEHYHVLPFYKLETRRYGPIKIVGIDPKKKNFRLDISKSPFPNKYPVFHVSEIEEYQKIPEQFVEEPKRNDKIIKILNCRKVNGEYQYLVTFQDYQWVNVDLFDKNSYYDKLLKEFQEHCYQRFLINVDN